jgi:hypothetical protein
VDSRWRDLGSIGICLVLGWLALGPLPRIPGLAVVDLGFASLGHLAGEIADTVLVAPVVPAVGGLVAPVAVPLAVAVCLLRSRREHHGGALCLAWAATVLTALAAEVLAAAEPGPAGPGGPHDWAVLLGPPGLRALDRAAGVAGVLRGGAVALLVAAVVLCAAPLLTNPRRTATARPQPAGAAWRGPTSRRV